MGTRFHVKMDIEGALKNRSFQGFVNEDGTKAHWRKVEKYLKEELAAGKIYLPFGECEGFDFKNGCPGHPTEKDQ